MSTLERSATFWLRAYPRRWRLDRAAEVTELLTDLAPPGATRLGVRTVAGLVRAGAATRWRQRPPLWAVLAYRLTDRRPAARYDGWLRDDVDGALYAWRASSALLLVLGPAWLTLSFALNRQSGTLLVGIALAYFATVVGCARGRAERRVVLFGASGGVPAQIGPMGAYRGLDR